MLINQVQIRNGFSMVELLVVVTIMAIVTGVGMAGYNRFNRTQQLKRSVNKVVTELRTAQKRADSGEQPGGACSTLNSFRVQINASSMRLYQICNGGSLVVPVGQTTMHPSVRLNGAAITLEFNTAQGDGGPAYSGPNSFVIRHLNLPATENITIVVETAGAIYAL